jgi:acetyl esterase/lipase
MGEGFGIGRAPGRRLVGRAAVVVALALVATGCLVPDPSSIRGTLGYQYEARERVDAEITWGSRSLGGDVYLPAGRPKGTIIYYSGGGFTRWITYGTEAALAHVRRGWAVFVPKYRLNQRFPAAVVDAVDAVRFVRTGGAAHGLNEDHVVVMGLSSGATLAGLVAVSNDERWFGHDANSRPDAWIAAGGTFAFETAGSRGGTWATYPADVRRDWFGPGQRVPALASALRSVSAGDPPAYLIHGEDDYVVHPDESTAMAITYDAFDLDVSYDVVSHPAGQAERYHVAGAFGANQAEVERFLDRAAA